MKTDKIGKLIALGAVFSIGTIVAQPDTTIIADPIYTTQPAPTQTVVEERRVVYDTVRTDRAMDQRTDRYTGLRPAELGVRYMPTFSSLRVRTSSGDVVQGELAMSHGWGVMLGYNFDRHIGIVGEVDYLAIEQKYKDRNLDRTVGVSYLNIPVMLSVNTNKTKPVNWNFVAGPQFGINIGSSLRTEGTAESGTVQAAVGVKQGDVGLAYGTGLEFALNRDHTLRADVGYRGFFGFLDMNADEVAPNTYNVIVKAARKSYAGYLGLTWCF
jgi:hypothetical protein